MPRETFTHYFDISQKVYSPALSGKFLHVKSRYPESLGFLCLCGRLNLFINLKHGKGQFSRVKIEIDSFQVTRCYLHGTKQCHHFITNENIILSPHSIFTFQYKQRQKLWSHFIKTSFQGQSFPLSMRRSFQSVPSFPGIRFTPNQPVGQTQLISDGAVPFVLVDHPLKWIEWTASS